MKEKIMANAYKEEFKGAIKKPLSMIIDFVTGNRAPNVGAESNRQEVERFLVNEKGFPKENIEVDVDIEFVVGGESYRSQIDLVVGVAGKRFMAIKCAAGSLGSREREILAASRLLDSYQIPFSIVSDGKTAIVLDTVAGKKSGEGLNAIPSINEAKAIINSIALHPLPEERIERERLIFRTYDTMNINVRRNVQFNKKER